MSSGSTVSGGSPRSGPSSVFSSLCCASHEGLRGFSHSLWPSIPSHGDFGNIAEMETHAKHDPQRDKESVPQLVIQIEHALLNWVYLDFRKYCVAPLEIKTHTYHWTVHGH